MNTVVKLTQQSVVGEIDSVLDTYPYQPYQQVFHIPDLRQDLISFVIHRLPGFYSPSIDTHVIINHEDTVSHSAHKLPRQPLEQKLHLQKLIHQGIAAIMRDKADLISDRISETIEPGCQTSNWFG